jgi:GNAT superfamily N-acetyltransferase
MDIIEFSRGAYTTSTDPARLDLPLIYDFLVNRSYWAKGRSFETVQRSVQNSLCFGLYETLQQIGFARVVTDEATFAWLCDVFVLESHRGRGLGKWLVECVVEHPALKNIRRIMLATKDAHELYRKHGGFTALEEPEPWMQRVRPYQ